MDILSKRPASERSKRLGALLSLRVFLSPDFVAVLENLCVNVFQEEEDRIDQAEAHGSFTSSDLSAQVDNMRDTWRNEWDDERIELLCDCEKMIEAALDEEGLVCNMDLPNEFKIVDCYTRHNTWVKAAWDTNQANRDELEHITQVNIRLHEKIAALEKEVEK